MSFAHAALFVICANIADNAAPDDPFAPDGPLAREMKRMQEEANFAASQPNPSPPTAIPWFNPKDLDFLDLVHELGRRGVSLQLIVEPPPNCRWHLDILKNESVILRLPVHRDTPLAWTEVRPRFSIHSRCTAGIAPCDWRLIRVAWTN